MVSERKSIIKELKKEINEIYLELGELANVDEDVNEISYLKNLFILSENIILSIKSIRINYYFYLST